MIWLTIQIKFKYLARISFQKERIAKNAELILQIEYRNSNYKVQYSTQMKQMSQTCISCNQKSDLINKYAKLIKLLQKKSSNSTLKSENSLSLKFFQTSGSIANSNVSDIGPDHFDSYKQPSLSLVKFQKTQNLKLGLIVLCNKIKKGLLKYYFQQIKAAAIISQPYHIISDHHDSSISCYQIPLSTLIQEILQQGRKIKTDPSCLMPEIKKLYMNNFYLHTKKLQYNQKIIRLQEQLEESEKRFFKQTEKKRQSLEAVAQELREKNDFIAELQHTIKQYQKISGKSFQKICVQNILVEDELQLKRACLRLQNVNQKLNFDLRNAQSKIFQLNQEIVLIQKQNLCLKGQVTQIKEINFDLLHQVAKTQQLTETYSNLCKKLRQKLKCLTQTQKKDLQAVKSTLRGNFICGSGDIFSSKNTEASSDSCPLSRKSSLKELEIEQKLEEIYSFIFNIKIQNYEIGNKEMFDEDELNLLKMHKDYYLSNVHNQNVQKKPRNQQLAKYKKLNYTDQILYLQSPQLSVENSFFNALEANHLAQITKYDSLKLMDIEIEKNKLIEKISDLKKMHMHIRDIFLNFLKAIEFNNLKPEAFRILEIIFQVFEYSQNEKSFLFKEKKKKFWGIL